MILSWTENAWSEYVSWQGDNKKVVKRIITLIRDAMRQPFEGIGSPEPLKHNLAGYWSRRIDKEHRLVYRVDGQGKHRTLMIIQCRFHYR